jgi:hypothetical protein
MTLIRCQVGRNTDHKGRCGLCAGEIRLPGAAAELGYLLWWPDGPRAFAPHLRVRANHVDEVTHRAAAWGHSPLPRLLRLRHPPP